MTKYEQITDKIESNMMELVTGKLTRKEHRELTEATGTLLLERSNMTIGEASEEVE